MQALLYLELPIARGVKHFKSWPILMYESTQGFHMYNANIFGLSMVKDVLGM